jgi:copper chaperone
MKTTIKIQNLKCGGCQNTITNKLSALTNINNVKVNVEESEVSFDYIDELGLLNAKETLKIIGYPEDGEANSIVTKAKTYVSCAIGKMN